MPPLSHEERENFPPVSHPLIRVHPDRSFKYSLFFTSNTSQEISGMTLTKGEISINGLLSMLAMINFVININGKK